MCLWLRKAVCWPPRQRRPAKEDENKVALEPLLGALWREAGGTLWGGVRQLEASFELHEELALFCPLGAHALWL